MIHSLCNRFSIFISQVLKGLGQIMLQENPITGLLILTGIFYGSVHMGLAALLAAACGTITARILKYNSIETDKGLYGFSAALTGVALVLFLKPLLITWMLIVAGAISATIVQHFFIRRNIPVFTLPFVLVTWLILFLAQYYSSVLLVQLPASSVSVSDYYFFSIKGFGQVIFQDKLLCGVIFFVAVFINSPVAALYGLAGSLLGGISAWYCSVPVEDINIGLFSYNAVLCAIVFAGARIGDGIRVAASVLLSLVISLVMLQYNLTQLTFPFVAASCAILRLERLFLRTGNKMSIEK